MKSFTTEPSHYISRGCTTVRNRCLSFRQILKEEGYGKELPLREAKDRFRGNMGIMDRASINNYFGLQPHREVRRWRREKVFPNTGTISVAHVNLSCDVPRRAGYFEILGLATIEKRGETWFFILTETVLVPQLSKPHYEVSEVSKGNFSLSSIAPKQTELEHGLIDSNVVTSNRENTHTTYRMRERNRSGESILVASKETSP